MSVSRNEFLSHADEIPTEEIPIPEWGEGKTLRVRCLSTNQRLAWGVALGKAQRGEPGPDPTALLVIEGAVDDNLKPLFQLQDVDALAEFRGDLIERFAGKVMDISGLGEDALSDAEGKSETAPNSTSPSTSPSDSDAPSES